MTKEGEIMTYAIGDEVIIKDEVIDGSDSCRLRSLRGKVGTVRRLLPKNRVVVCWEHVPIYPNCLNINANKVVAADSYADYQAERMEENMERANHSYWDYREEYGHW